MDKSKRRAWWGNGSPSTMALDFGCSVGYGVAQLRKSGFDAIGFEVSRVRAEAGSRALGVQIESDFDSLLANYRARMGLIYADHVLEHLPRLRPAIEGFSQLLAIGGRLVVFVPNGSGRLARTLGTRWSALIGETHSIAFTARWFLDTLPLHGFEIDTLGSTPGKVELLPDDEELVCVARRIE